MKHKKNKLTKIKSVDALMLKLGQSKMVLGCCEISQNHKPWQLFLKQVNGQLREVAEVGSDLIEILLSQGVIEVVGNKALLTRAGRIAIKRKLTNGGDCLGQHQDRALKNIDGGGGKRVATLNLSESPLGWLYTRKDKNGKPFIEEFQFTAGERLRADYERGALQAQVTSNWDAFHTPKQSVKKGANGGLTLSEKVMLARKRVHDAINAVGPELSGILLDICCYHKGIEDAEKHNGWPPRSGKVILSLALSRLGRHYGLVSDEKHLKKHSSHISRWGTEDYRPSIENWVKTPED